MPTYTQAQPYATDVTLDGVLNTVDQSDTFTAELFPVDDGVPGNYPTCWSSGGLASSPSSFQVQPGSYSLAMSFDPPAPGDYLFCAFDDGQPVENDQLTIPGPQATVSASAQWTGPVTGFFITVSGTTPLPAELFVSPAGDCVPMSAPSCAANALDAAAPIGLGAGAFSVTLPPWLPTSWVGNMVAWVAASATSPAYGDQYFYPSEATQAPPDVTAPAPIPTPAPAPKPDAAQTTPRAQLSLHKLPLRTAVRDGVIPVLVHCDAPCTTKLKLSVVAARRRRHTTLTPIHDALAGVVLTLDAAGSRTATFVLTKAARARLGSDYAVRITATATVTTPGGQAAGTITSNSITLER